MIIETVPNISEGRNIKLINHIVRNIKKINNLELKDVHFDYDHNRSVFTILGKPASIFESIFEITKNCLGLDINIHSGVHPCAGIVDVIPFIPVKGISYKRLIFMVENFAYRFFKKFKIPVYLYALSSKRPTTKNLSTIRNKGINFIKSLSYNDKDFLPDIFDEEIFHPTMGVSFIGVRYPLIAFNFNIKIDNGKKEEVLRKVKYIAKRIRESGGGIKNLQALVFSLESRNLIQLSTNILNAHETDFVKIFNTVLEKIKEENLELEHTELVGCLPSVVVQKIMEYFLKLKSFSVNKIINFEIY